jgi:hypothetical protein
MNDEELLDAVEEKVLLAMLQGCAMDDHHGRKVFDPCPWVVTIRADQMSRLIDLAKKAHDEMPDMQRMDTHTGDTDR